MVGAKWLGQKAHPHRRRFTKPNIAVVLEDDALTAHLPGGMWLVRACWTEQGMTNPIAVFRNAIIAFSWTLFCCAVAAVLPWPRTMRSFLTRSALPSTLSEIIKIFRCHENFDEAKETRNAISGKWRTFLGAGKASESDQI